MSSKRDHDQNLQRWAAICTIIGVPLACIGLVMNALGLIPAFGLLPTPSPVVAIATLTIAPTSTPAPQSTPKPNPTSTPMTVPSPVNTPTLSSIKLVGIDCTNGGS